MEERVQCAECQETYDCGQHAFCPRCGSLKEGPPTAQALQRAARRDPRRRRVQMAGLVFLVLGGIFAINLGVAAIQAPALTDDMTDALAGSQVGDGAGGSLQLAVRWQGGPVAANVTFMVAGEESGHTRLDAAPVHRLDLPAARTNITITTDHGQWQRQVFVPAGQSASLSLDEQSLPEDDAWVSSVSKGFTRTVSLVGLAWALLVAAGGLAGLLVRWWPLAVTGAALLAVPFAIVAALVPSLLLVLNAILVVVAGVIIVRGRKVFPRRQAAS